MEKLSLSRKEPPGQKEKGAEQQPTEYGRVCVCVCVLCAVTSFLGFMS